MFSSLLTKSLTTFLAQSNKDCTSDECIFTIPPDKKFGDICINIFPAVKATKTPPQILAKEVLDFMTQESYVTRGEIQGGFVNLFVTDDFYFLECKNWTLPAFEKKDETVVIDYMGANIGKPLHIGHLCTPLFGQASINLLRYMGYDVIADMHQGDWGGLFGKLIIGWKYYWNEEAFTSNPVKHLFEIYVLLTEKIEKEGLSIEQECRDAFKLLSEWDPIMVQLWEKFTDKSLIEVRNVMNEFGAKPDIWIGESFYEWLPLPKLGNWTELTPDNTMTAVVKDLITQWIATKNEDKSVGVVFSKESKLPSCILQKKDGTHGYLASDLASIRYRIKNWQPSQILYFVDNRQSLHFRQLFATAQASWSKSKIELPTTKLTHAANGFVSLPEGAMSTRHGRVIFLRDLIAESFDRVKNILSERNKSLSEKDIKAIALGSIVYSFMSQDRERDWVFEWDNVLTFEGNSGPYLQYTYVRWKKILLENNYMWALNIKPWTLNVVLTTFDRDLILDIMSFNDTLSECGKTYKFHLLVAHIALMARHLNALYVNTPKIKDTEENEQIQRLQIVSTCLSIIEFTTKIVGIPLPEEM